MKKIILILALIMQACAGGNEQKHDVYVREKIVWTVDRVERAKYSYVLFSGLWRGIPVYNRSVNMDGYYHKEFSIKFGDTVHQNVNIILSRESDKTVIEVYPRLPVKKYVTN